MKRRHLPVILFVAALLVAGGFGALKAQADGGCWMVPIMFIEGPGAQDTNNDGIATIAEGMFSCDQDPEFTQVDAMCLGNCRMLVWSGQPAGGKWEPKAYCLLDFTNNLYTCITNTNWDCWKTGNTCTISRSH